MPDRVTNADGQPFAEVAKDGEMDSLDEIVMSNAFIHLERMDDDHIWIGITDSTGRLWHVNLHAVRGTAVPAGAARPRGAR